MYVLETSQGRAKKRQMKHFKKKGMLKTLTALSLTGLLALSSLAVPSLNGVLAADDTSKLLAFSTAEGGGRFASGGRNYDVYVVTSLEDYARDEKPVEGTLRYGLEEFAKPKEDGGHGGAIIVFNVGGTIHLKHKLVIAYKNITIAGQTAPGDGITIAGYDTDISGSENLIIRYMRFRPGAENVFNGGDSMDALWGRDNKTFIIDHCSFSWNTDETLSTYRGQDGTVQWCIISESLTVSGHSKGRHGYGGIFGGDNVVFQYNLIANHTSRNPRIGGGFMGDPARQDAATGNPNIARVQISNSILYNWGYNTCYGGGYTWSNYINNYLKAGVGTRDKVRNQIIDAGEKNKRGGFYVSGNYLEGNAALSEDNSKGLKKSGDTSGNKKTDYVTTPYEAEGFNNITLVSAQDCYEPILNRAGATYPYRDAIDARVVYETKTDTGRYINTEDEVGGYPAATVTREADFDKDKDGIPDAWETAHGLNPNDATDSAKINPNTGYAYIEEYFNGLVEDVEKTDYKAPNPTIILDLKDNAQYKVGSDVAVTANVTPSGSSGDGVKRGDLNGDGERTSSDAVLLKKHLASMKDLPIVDEKTCDVDGNGDVNVRDAVILLQFLAGMDVNIDDSSNNTSTTSTIEKVEFYNGDKLAGTVTEAPYTYVYKGLEDGTYNITARVYDSNGNKTQSSVSKLHMNSTNSSGDWISKDIGAPEAAGSASLTDGVLTVKGSGKLGLSESTSSSSGMWGKANTDNFQFTYQEVTGDTELVTKLDYATVVDNHVFTGIMFRDGLDVGSKTVALGLSLVKLDESSKENTTWSAYMVNRATTNGNINTISETIDSKSAADKAGIPIIENLKFKTAQTYNGVWFKLARIGNDFIGYVSEDGTNWKYVGKKTVSMNEKVYVGFAVDANKVANKLVNLSTAKFSNISLGSNFANVNLDLTNVTADSVKKISVGTDYEVQLKNIAGYKLPETVEVNIGNSLLEASSFTYDAATGKLSIPGSVIKDSSTITIKAAGVKVEQGDIVYKPETVGDTTNVTITDNGNTMNINQSATDGNITSKKGSEGKNISYVVFPESEAISKMTLNVKVNSFAGGKNTGVFVGAFQTAGDYLFNSFSIRNTGDGNAASMYWVKKRTDDRDGEAGNGSPKAAYTVGSTYNITVEKKSGLYTISCALVGADGTVGTKQNYTFAASGAYLTADQAARFGLAITGADVTISDWIVYDTDGNQLYNQTQG